MEKNILVGSGVEDNFSPYLNMPLNEYLLKMAQIHGNKTILIDAVTDEKLTSDELIRKSTILANHLRAMGILPGQVVGIICENKIEFLVVTLSIFHIGAVLTTFNPSYEIGELEHVMKISKPVLVFSSSQNFKKVEALYQKLPFLQNIIMMDQADVEYPSVQTVLLDDTHHMYEPVKSDPNDIAIILYTSGTTGLPKGVALTHKNILHVLELTRIGIIPTVKGDYAVGTIPMFNAYGTLVNFLSLSVGFTLIVMKKFDEILFLSCVEKYKVKFLYMVPPLVALFAKSALIESYDLSSLEELVCGGSPPSLETLKKIKTRLNLKRTFIGYGMSETSFSAVQCRRNEVIKPLSCGKILPGMKCKVIDVDTGISVGPMEKGELYFSGPNVMKEYFGDMEETNKVLDSNGWLRSGDFGYYDNDGYVFIIDRVNDIIKYKDYQIAPSELESLLLTHPDIKDVGVIGIPDKNDGEIPKAFVVKQEGSLITESDILKYVEDHVSSEKILRGGVRFVDEIPKNAGGKILRRILKKLFHSHS